MRLDISYATLALALAAGAPAANAQTVITRDIVTQPVETVTTTETVRPIHPGPRAVERRIVTTRQTVLPPRVAPAPAIVATAPAPVYNTVAPPPPPAPVYDVVAAPPATPLYDSAVTPVYDTAAPIYDTTIAPAAAQVPLYRYVYEPDRILVIDPATNVAVQAIPR